MASKLIFVKASLRNRAKYQHDSEGFGGGAVMTWIILCGIFIAAAALMVTTLDQMDPVEPHPWLVEPQNASARAAGKTRRLVARFRH